jgi:hypothetical protein
VLPNGVQAAVVIRTAQTAVGAIPSFTPGAIEIRSLPLLGLLGSTSMTGAQAPGTWGPDSVDSHLIGGRIFLAVAIENDPVVINSANVRLDDGTPVHPLHDPAGGLARSLRHQRSRVRPPLHVELRQPARVAVSKIYEIRLLGALARIEELVDVKNAAGDAVPQCDASGCTLDLEGIAIDPATNLKHPGFWLCQEGAGNATTRDNLPLRVDATGEIVRSVPLPESIDAMAGTPSSPATASKAAPSPTTGATSTPRSSATSGPSPVSTTTERSRSTPVSRASTP